MGGGEWSCESFRSGIFIYIYFLTFISSYIFYLDFIGVSTIMESGTGNMLYGNVAMLVVVLVTDTVRPMNAA